MDSLLALPNPPSPRVRGASYLLAAAALLLILALHMVPALLTGLPVFELAQAATTLLGRRISGDRARVLIVTVLGVVVVGLLILVILSAVNLFRHEIGNPQLLWQQQLMPLVDKARQQLPAVLVNHLPDSVDDLRRGAGELARKHAVTLQLTGRENARVLLRMLAGLVPGAIIALRRTRPPHQSGPLAVALGERCRQLAEAFHNVVFAQLKISLVNTALTAIFLLGVLPLLGIHVPLAKTLMVITFLFGLLPVVGNLLSTTGGDHRCAVSLAGGGGGCAGVPGAGAQVRVLTSTRASWAPRSTPARGSC